MATQRLLGVPYTDAEIANARQDLLAQANAQDDQDALVKRYPKAVAVPGQPGFPSEMEAFGLQFGHGLGLHLHERPVISRLNSIDHPSEIKEGMVFALETYCPAKDGFSAARIEEEIVVTSAGPKIITRFPAQELFIANAYDYGGQPR